MKRFWGMSHRKDIRSRFRPRSAPGRRFCCICTCRWFLDLHHRRISRFQSRQDLKIWLNYHFEFNFLPFRPFGHSSQLGPCWSALEQQCRAALTQISLIQVAGSFPAKNHSSIASSFFSTSAAHVASAFPPKLQSDSKTRIRRDSEVAQGPRFFSSHLFPS